MSIYGSLEEVGEHGDDAPRKKVGTPDDSVLSYLGSHVYPNPSENLPGSCGLAFIPGFCVPGRKEEETVDTELVVDDVPFGDWLRLDVCEFDHHYRRPMCTGTVVLNRAAATRLRDQLTWWIDAEHVEDV